MSRDSNGNYTLPGAYNPVVAGTVITDLWANTTLDDVKVALTDSLSRSGKGGMTAPFRLTDGTVSAPAFSFNTETTTGFYRAAAGDIRITVQGADAAQFTASNIRFKIAGSDSLTLSATANTSVAPLFAPTAPLNTNTTQVATMAALYTMSQNLPAGALPNLTGNAGKYLTNNGTTVNWADVLPSQTGNAGRFLQTSGTTTSWSPLVYSVGTIALLSRTNVANTVTGTYGDIYLKTGVVVTRAAALSAGYNVTELEALGACTPLPTTGLAFSSPTRVGAVNGVFVASTGSNAYRSTDGVNWTLISGNGWINCTNVFACTDLFVGNGTGSTQIITSPDGINWTARSHPFSGDVVMGACKVASRYCLFTTNNGLRSTLDFSTYLNSTPWVQFVGGVSYANGEYVTKGGNFSGVFAFNPGTNLAPRAMNIPSSFAVARVAFAGGRYIALANSGTTGYTSTDGVNWVSNSTSLAVSNTASANRGGGGKPDIAYNGTNLYMTVNAAVSAAVTSPDGITWTTRGAITRPRIDYVGTRFFNYDGWTVTRGANSGASYSSDGITWTATTGMSSVSVSCIIFANGIYLATSGDGTNSQIWSSGDGITWTARLTVANVDFGMSSVAWNATIGRFMAVGTGVANAVGAWTSTTGTSWSGVSGISGLVAPVNFVASCNDRFIIAAEQSSGSQQLFRSTDGTTASACSMTGNTSTTSSRVLECFFNDGMYMAISENQSISTSIDGITFSQSGGSVQITSTVDMIGTSNWGVAVGQGTWTNCIAASRDGVAWMPIPPGSVALAPGGVFRGATGFGNTAYYQYNTTLYNQAAAPMGYLTASSITGTGLVTDGTRVLYVLSSDQSVQQVGVGALSFLSGSFNSYNSAYNGTTFVFINNASTAFTSPDGKTGAIGINTAITVTNTTGYVKVK